MKSWKKQLNEEFDRAVPALKDDVKNAPIITGTTTDTSVVRTGNKVRNRRIGISSAFLAAVLALVFSLLGIFGVFSPPATSVPERFIVTLEINPAVAFVTDKQGIVQSVNALNEDADVLLTDETLRAIINVPLTDAVVTYTDSAAKLGYLDVSADSTAVRLSSSTETDETLLKCASERLQSYCKTNGIYAAVVSDVLSVNELCGRLGVPETDTLSDLISALESLSVRFGERVDSNAGAEQLQSLYTTFILGLQTLDCVRNELLESLDSIVTNAQMLSQMTICYYDIMWHTDNPFSPIPADYWTVKNYSDEKYTDEFAALMNEMEDLLTAYESTFGVAMKSQEQFKSAADIYATLSDVNFAQLFAALTVEDFQASAETYVGILENIGYDVAAFESVLSVPQTAQEYLTQYRTILDQLVRSRTERFKDAYEQPRTAISDAQYSEFINGILSEYGSLENFWNTL